MAEDADDPRVAGLVPAAGTPCWIDLATPDGEAARAFYSGLFGWSYSIGPDPATGRYTIATLNGISVAGMYHAVPNQLPAWNLHLAVANAASAAEWVESLGGRIILAPVEIPGRGAIVHAQDPTGATFVLWQTPHDWEFGTRYPGMFSGTDLHTHDGASADAFYCRLFPFASYQIGFGESGTDATASRALALGGSIATVPFDTAFGRAAVLIDPGGAPFGIIDRTRAVEDWRRWRSGRTGRRVSRDIGG